ncbi:Asp-tRNA(Asn)/Glu-tRNA(Gln) amidotransferase subunit GatB [Candidatus Uhrbacteria bacterium]|nr:Asp-tRNA(Asn)/Glu-tRNA(Gln) amidotransferase subunit GatB [Candidatus Uhrbacteria bacterium]
MPYESIIGLEIHVQLKTKSKLFCSCDNESGEAPPNKNICPICMGHPGTLPVLNRQALEYALLAALALNCKIPEKAKFDRKNYFYPDLPKGYQISQFDEPICVQGTVLLDLPANKENSRTSAVIRITRIHMEEDAAKNIHADEKTYVDFNRAGTPLIEIVTEPDFRSPAETKIFLQELRRTMRYLEISDADMEKGHMRCDANISLRPQGTTELAAKTELKNINSFRAVERALTYEITRQTKMWEEGAPPKGATTRGWDDLKEATFEQRGKEGSADYRYFPEPDLPPLLLPEIVEKVRPRLPELPRARRLRFQAEYGFIPSEALLLTEEKYTADYVEKVMMELRTWIRDLDIDDEEVPTSRPIASGVGIPTDSVGKKWEEHKKKLIKLFSGWFISKLTGLLEKHAIDIRKIKITPENFAEFLIMLQTSRINSAAGLQVLEEMLLSGEDPSQIVSEKKLEQISNEEEIAVVVKEVITANPQPVADFKAGKQNALQFLVGQVMKASRGKANPDLAQKLLKKLLQ